MAYFLGFDAGATKTECVLAEDDTIIARATGGSIKIMRPSAEEAGENLDVLLQSIGAQSGVPLASIRCTSVGLSGISVPRVANWVRQALHARVGGDVLLAGDQEVALDAAFPGGPGVLVVAGTGSNMVGRSTSGQIVKVGGWGPILADEGSGSTIGRRAVRAVFDALDRDQPTLLIQKIFDYWSLEEIGGLIDLANQSPGPDFSKLTPLVVECAAQGDASAHAVLEQAGNDLGMYAALAARRVRALEPQGAEYPEIAFTGSVVRHIAPVRHAMCAQLQREIPGIRIQAEAVDAVHGALWRARQHSKNHSAI